VEWLDSQPERWSELVAVTKVLNKFWSEVAPDLPPIPEAEVAAELNELPGHRQAQRVVDQSSRDLASGGVAFRYVRKKSTLKFAPSSAISQRPEIVRASSLIVPMNRCENGSPSRWRDHSLPSMRME
jgi:hypothetical protein